MLNESADDGIVEVVYVLPLYTLQHILLLLRLQSELDEHLLELLIAVVDDELLKTVAVQYLEPIDVQDTHHLLLAK